METGNEQSRNPGIFEDPAEHPLSLVQSGMRVIDADGEHIGEVTFVKMGDPEAATTGRQPDEGGGLIRDVARAFGFEGEPDVSPTLRARLLRNGYVRIDSRGLGASDRYVMADDIAGVASDTVRLAVRGDQIPGED